MTSMQSEVYEAFRSIDIPEDKALKAAAALAGRDADVGALRADVGTLKTDVSTMKGDVSALKADVSSLKADNVLMKWMLGFVLAFQVALMFRVFSH